MSPSDRPAEDGGDAPPLLILGQDLAPKVLRRRRGRPPKPVVPSQVVLDSDFRQKEGLREWVHYHHERERPFNWRFAATNPALGHLFLKTIYSMSGEGNVIESQKSADSYRSYVKPFFLWLSAPWLHEFGPSIGSFSSELPPEVWKSYKEYVDRRVLIGDITSKSGYQYKGSISRILQRIWYEDPSVLGPGWHERLFLLDEFDDDSKQREPYSAAEARRILDYSTGILGEAAKDGRAEDPYDYLVEIACYTALSLRLGIESECLDGLKIGDVRPNADGSIMRVTYTKRRVRRQRGRSRTTDPINPPNSDGESLVEQIGSFRTAGGLLALMLRRASLMGKGPEDKLWLRRLSAVEFRRYTGILSERGLRCDYGAELKIDRTKFRVTYKTAKNVRSKGMLPLVSDDNTPDVRARHYDESERMKPFYEQAVEDAAIEALSYALEGPKVVPLPVDAESQAVASVAADLDVPVDQIQAALSGETDVWLSSCRNFFKSPFDAPGKPCSKAFFKCLACGNALVTRRSLPRLIRFLSHIVTMRTVLPEIDWQLKFGETYNTITRHILPRFPDAALAEARIIAQGSEADLHIAPELLT